MDIDDTRNDDPFALIGGEHVLLELQLIRQLRTATSNDDRNRLIAELQAVPERFHPFYSRWLFIHGIAPFDCWINTGYDPSISDIPRDIQLLSATAWGISDIENGGFHQFFANHTGIVAPEMAEWFERAGMSKAAEL